MYFFIPIIERVGAMLPGTFVKKFGMNRTVRNLIIGEKNYIESWNEYRRVILSGQYAMISMAVLGIYIWMEFPDFHTETLGTFIVSAALVVASLFLHRVGKHCYSNIVLFSTLNILIYLVSASESVFSGCSAFFIPLALGTFAVFNYTQKIYAIAFSTLSFLLLMSVFTKSVSLLPFRDYTTSYLQFNLAFNSAIAFTVSLMTIYLLIRINYYNAKELLNANKQLVKLNQELDRFVYSTSHDLRAPLLSVKGLLKISEKATEEEKIKYLQLMEKRIDNLDNFIKDITDYSRNNRLEVVRENVNLFLMAEEIWESLRYCEEAKGIEFRNEIPKDLEVTHDSKRIKVVLSNLISNAVRYHDQRKENRYIRLHHHLTESSFSLHLEDNGQGIPTELQTKIFEMFFRGNESSQGSGLGLYIVKETIGKLSGQIRLQSTPSKGSTFIVTVPV